MRWSKLALNSAITTLGAVGGEPLGVILRYHYVRCLTLEIITELVRVARMNAVRLEKVSGTIDLERIALPPGFKGRPVRSIPNLAFRHAVLMAVGFKYRRLRSSMLYALERGRPPEVDHLKRLMGPPLRRNRLADSHMHRAGPDHDRGRAGAYTESMRLR